MAATTVTAHVVVEFGGQEDSPNVIVEVDSRPDGYNSGKTSFQPGENAYLLLYVPPGWSCVYEASSAGAISYVENTTVDIEDFLTFVDDDTSSIQYPSLAGSHIFTWLGNDLGLVSVANDICSLAARAYNAVTKVFTPAHRVGISKLNYKSVARVYRLSSVPVSVLKVAVMFVVRKD